MQSIRRYGDDGGWPVRGEWRAIRVDRMRSASLCCPSCGTTGVIEGHQIAANGRVIENVICVCGWNEFVKLEGWVPQ